jgi:hypothetical protein
VGQPVTVEAVHTPIAKRNGALSGVRPGHPVGSTGARLLTTAVHNLERGDGVDPRKEAVTTEPSSDVAAPTGAAVARDSRSSRRRELASHPVARRRIPQSGDPLTHPRTVPAEESR